MIDTTAKWALGPITAFNDSDDTVSLGEWIIFSDYGTVAIDAPISTESSIEETGGQYGPLDAYIGDYDGVLRKIEMSGKISAKSDEEYARATRFVSMMEGLQSGEQYDYGPFWLVQGNVNAWPCDWRYRDGTWTAGVVPSDLPPSWNYSRVGICAPVMISKFSHKAEPGTHTVEWSVSFTVGQA